MADSLRSSHKMHDDDHEHIGSASSTPPNGTATPRPDLHDKRLPGLSSYFAQVRDSMRCFNKSSADPAPEPAPAPAQSHESTAAAAQISHALAGASQEAESQQPGSPPLLPHEDTTQLARSQQQHAYPTTPPLSSSSSFLAMGNVEASSDGSAAAASLSRQLSLAHRKKSQSQPSSPSKLRRDTLSGFSTLSITQPAISAHISNPSVELSRALPASAAHVSPSSPSHSQRMGTTVLTTDATQNTPPHTPRTGSHASRSKEGDVANIPHANNKTSRSSSGGSRAHSPSLRQARGQLEVSIEEARGIRPAVDPYVVCIFQLNEDISDGPQGDEMDYAVENEPADDNLAKGVAMKRLGSGSGTPIAIPGLKSRQTSSTNIADMRRGSNTKRDHVETTDPIWRHKTTFDVVGDNNEIDISVYDRANNESFIGHVRLPLNLDDYEHQHEDWYKLRSREGRTETVTGEIHLRIAFNVAGKRTFGPDDFEILKLIGKGTFGQVFQVRKKDTKRIYAMKVLSKKVIVQKKEIQHTIGERNILVRTATTESPFIVGLKFSFQTAADLYLVTDYMSGGELFWHLQKEGRFVEERAKFYIAELILALRHLHQHDIVYRDLKPENILLDANGHIALCDFGLSKANLAKNDTTNTFCGTTEYLAPEVLLDEAGYTKMVDFWSLGVLVFEMCCGWSPFYAEDTQQMYKNIAFGKVRFPRDALSADGRSFVKGLLNRNPSHRLGAKGDAEELMAQPFFHDVDWDALSKKLCPPPFKPKLKGELDTSNFDPEFTNALNPGGEASSLNARAAALASGINTDSTPLSPTMQNQFKGFTFVDESTLEQQFGNTDPGYDGAADSNRLSRTFSNKAGDRMSGLEPTNAPSADEDFNHGMLDDI